jgi:hypothetical protein
MVEKYIMTDCWPFLVATNWLRKCRTHDLNWEAKVLEMAAHISAAVELQYPPVLLSKEKSPST